MAGGTYETGGSRPPDTLLDSVVWGRCRAGAGWFWMARRTAWDGTVRDTAHGWRDDQEDALRDGAAAARRLAAGTRAQVFLRHRAAEHTLRLLLEDGAASTPTPGPLPPTGPFLCSPHRGGRPGPT
ncbi:hypothetical protein [Streptomyces sp. NPDC097619]|uniref:hypothetical protein n=1 Tax=Streptomyces sp. NPDC097619 TaxID=3157228 RepID=UPI0033240E5F